MVPALHNFKIANILSVASLAISLVGVAMQIVCGYGVVLYIVAGVLAVGGLALYFIAARTRRRIAKELGKAILNGKELFMRGVKTDEDYNLWRSNFSEWHKIIKGFIASEISEEASIWFTNITSNTAIKLRGAYGGSLGEHNGLLHELNAYLEKAGELLSRY
jgi:hypothetical protein